MKTVNLNDFILRLLFLPVILVLLLFGSSCFHNSNKQNSTANNPSRSPAANVLDDYLQTDFPAADGFDFAVGDPNGKGPYQDKSTGQTYNGWYVATQFAEKYNYGIHTGEDWSGLGPRDSDLGQDVMLSAVAESRLLTSAANCGATWS